jgi:SAM-dependent methyltransferase
MRTPEASEAASRNRELWTRLNAKFTDVDARAQWGRDTIAWGLWSIPESEVGVLPELDGLDVVELGCGTAFVSSWLARRGARPVAVDITPAQLDTARRMQAETGIEFPLVEADAVATGLPDATFDLAISDYGASIWCDPELWIREASRLLRPGGTLVFLCDSTLLTLCGSDDARVQERLVRPQFGMYRFEAAEGGGVEFHLAHSDWIRILRDNGLVLEQLVEVQAPEDASMHEFYDYVTPEWGRSWPAEEIWKARKWN